MTKSDLKNLKSSFKKKMDCVAGEEFHTCPMWCLNVATSADEILSCSHDLSITLLFDGVDPVGTDGPHMNQSCV